MTQQLKAILLAFLLAIFLSAGHLDHEDIKADDRPDAPTEFQVSELDAMAGMKLAPGDCLQVTSVETVVKIECCK